jgi:ABC-2 type transport system permease protein
MLRNVFLKTLRDFRLAILLWGGGVGLIMFYYSYAYADFFKGPNREQMMADYTKAVEAMSFLTGKAVDVSTVGGFITMEFMNYLPLLLGLWALMAGSGLIRREEERNSLDLLISTPVSRTGIFLEKWLAYVLALVAIVALLFAGTLLGASVYNQVLPYQDLFEALFNAFITTVLFGNLALLASQMTTRRSAAGFTGGILIASYLLNSVSYNVKSLDLVRPISPFYYYDKSKPLAKGMDMDWGAVLPLIAVGLLFMAVALYMYLKRDHNGVFTIFHSKKVRDESWRAVPKPNSLWLKNEFLFAFRTALPGILIWGISIALYIVLMMSIFKEIKSSMLSMLQADFMKTFGFATVASDENLLHLILFLFVVVLFMVYTVTQVANWRGEESSGRLELLLSTPKSRLAMLFNYYLVSLIASALVVGMSYLTFVVCAEIVDINVSSQRVFETFAGGWISCVIIASAGYLLTALKAGWAVEILSGILTFSILIDLLRESLKLPGWLVDLSVLHQYGQPMLTGLAWGSMLVLLAVSSLFMVAALFRFRQRDIRLS